jgi:hypothetical protein
MHISLLSDEPPPLDLNLALVSPVVHEHLLALTYRVQTSVTELADGFVKLMYEFQVMSDALAERDQHMGELHVLMGTRLMLGMKTKQGAESRYITATRRSLRTHLSFIYSRASSRIGSKPALHGAKASEPTHNIL